MSRRALFWVCTCAGLCTLNAALGEETDATVFYAAGVVIYALAPRKGEP